MIEHNIFQVCIDKEDMDKYPLFKQSSQLFQDLNPDWNYKLWHKEDIDKFLEEYYPKFIDFYNQLRYRVIKADFIRLLLIYHYGGFYFDLDIIPFKPLNELKIENSYIFYNFKNIPIKSDWPFKINSSICPNDFMACNSFNFYFRDLIDYCVSEYNLRKDNPLWENRKCRFVFHTFGPNAITRFIKKNKLVCFSGLMWSPYCDCNKEDFYFENHNTNTWFSMTNKHKNVKII